MVREFEKSDVGHAHDGRYFTRAQSDGRFAAVGHDHDADYAAIGHNHDGTYSSVGHDHDSDYAPLVHDHDSAYSAIGHDHDSDYSALGHTHDDRYYTESEVDTLVADAISDYETDLAAKIAYGTETISGSSIASGSYASAAVSYGKTLPGLAADIHVTVTMAGYPGGSGGLVPRVSSVGTTGFNLYLTNVTASALTWSNLPVRWRAEAMG